MHYLPLVLLAFVLYSLLMPKDQPSLQVASSVVLPEASIGLKLVLHLQVEGQGVHSIRLLQSFAVVHPIFSELMLLAEEVLLPLAILPQALGSASIS